MFKIPFAFALAVVFNATDADGADIKVVQDGGHSVISLTGDIAGGDATKLERLLQYRGLYAGIRLNYGGGNAVEGIELAKLVRNSGLPATVPAGKECASACAIVCLCAVDHRTEAGARVGVHGSQAPNGDEDEVAYAIKTWVARIVKDCGAPADVVAAWVTVPASEVYWIETETGIPETPVAPPLPFPPTRPASIAPLTPPVQEVKQPYIDVYGRYIIPARVVAYIGQPWPQRPNYQSGLAVVREMFGQRGPVFTLADGSIAISMLAATRTVQFVVDRSCVETCVYQSMDGMLRGIVRRAGVS
jgi:hypothetical protein